MLKMVIREKASIENLIGYGENGLEIIGNYTFGSLEEMAVATLAAEQLKHYLPLARQVVCQTRRGIIQGESVPAQEKIVSISCSYRYHPERST